jgi:hypothetical protein
MMNSATCSFEILRYLHNILHERKGHSRMSSTIACVKSELTGLLDRGSSLNSVLPDRKGFRYFFTVEIWSPSSPYTFVSFLSIFLALRPLIVKKQTTARCYICHLFAFSFTQNEVSDNCAPYRSISLNFILLADLFHKESSSRLIISLFSTSKK